MALMEAWRGPASEAGRRSYLLGAVRYWERHEFFTDTVVNLFPALAMTMAGEGAVSLDRRWRVTVKALRLVNRPIQVLWLLGPVST